MPSFQHADPIDTLLTPIERLRVWECHRLADAYDIPYRPNATKRQMLPVLKTAQETGVFQKPPPHPELLLPPGQRGKAEMAKASAVVGQRSVEWLGAGRKWVIMEGSIIASSGHASREDAEAQMNGNTV